MSGKIIGIISIKGGVGKTTTALNLAAALANEFGKNVFVIDANFSAPNLRLHLGIVKVAYSINDVLADKVDITKAIMKHELGFDIVTAALVPMKKVNPFKLKRKIGWLKHRYDIILLDSSPTLNEEMLSTMIASDELLVVTSPDYPTLSCTMHATKIAKEKKTPISGLILNKVRGEKFELTIEDIENATNVPVLAVFDDDAKILEALAETKPAVIYAPKRDVSVEYKKLAASLIGERYIDKRFIARLKNLFIGGLSKAEINRTLHKDGIKRE